MPATTDRQRPQRPIQRSIPRTLTLLGLAVATGAGTQAVLAQQRAGADVLEEVLVTASKRGAQRLQDLPVAVQALTSDLIESQVAMELSDMASQVSSLIVQDLGPGDREYIIRGVNSTATATVGVYYDEAVITARSKQDGGGRQADIELHDLARVEVLKGPQGTLYGASSMSGTVRYIPNRPDPTKVEGNVGGFLSTTEDGGDNYHVDGTINVPIIEDVLALRAVGWTTREDGFVDNLLLNNDDINDNEVDGGKLALEWRASERLTLSAFGLRQDREVGGTSRQMPQLQDTFADNRMAFADALAGAGFPNQPAAQERTTQSYTATPWDEELELYSAKFEWNAGPGTLLGAVSQFERDVFFNFDSTPILLFFGVPVPAITAQPQSRELTNAEVRWSSDLKGPVQFVVGGFMSEEDKDFEVNVIATGPDGFPVAEFQPGDPNTFFGRTKTDSLEEEALFGEVEWTLNDRWTALAGIRWYNFEINSENQELQPFGGVPADFPTRFNVDADEVTGKFNLAYRVNDDALVYGTWSQGFRPGGTNDVAFIPPGTTPPPAGFGPDQLDNWELGWKLSMAGGRVTFNGAVYYIEWEDIQVSTFDPASPFEVVRNQGEAEITGIEFDLSATPVDGLRFSVVGALTEAEYTSDIPGASPDAPFATDGDRIPNVPDFQLTGTVGYSWPVLDGLDASARLDATWMDDRLIAPNNPVANVDLESFTLVNARLGIESTDWNLSLFAKNLLDEDNAAYDAINTNQDPRGIVTARPRTVGLQVRYNFGG